MHNIQPWPIYCWLQRAGSPYLYCPWLVSKVCATFIWVHFVIITFPRCWAPKDNLDEDALNHTCAFNEALFEESDLDTMWVEYSIVRDLVMHCIFFWVTQSHIYSPLAVYKRLSPCRHTPIDCTRYFTPVDQRVFQGPPSWLGLCVYLS